MAVSFFQSYFECFNLSVGLDKDAFFHIPLMKYPLENVSRGLHHASLPVHHLIIHALRGDIPDLGIRIGDCVSSSITFSLSMVVGIYLEASIVPKNCGAMQVPVRKLAETIEAILLI